MRKLQNVIATLVSACLIVVLLHFTPALADVKYQKGLPYSSANDCVEVRSETSHGSGAGYYKAEVWSKQKSAMTGTNCADLFPRPPQYIKLGVNGWVSWDETYICWTLSPFYKVNSSPGSKVSAIVKETQTYPLCGCGYYGLDTYGWMLNGSWKGGGVWSGWHYLPTNVACRS